MAAEASDWLRRFRLFASEPAEWNATKLDRKQDFNVLYQVCVFRANRKKQDGCPGLWLAETFWTSSLKPLKGIQRNLTGSKISTSSTSTKFVFFRRWVKKNAALAALSKRWRIVLRCTICGPLGLLFLKLTFRTKKKKAIISSMRYSKNSFIYV